MRHANVNSLDEADLLAGQGSVQATTDPSSLGSDSPFWDALNTHVKNIHAVISGHGEYKAMCVAMKTILTVSHLQITGTSGVPESLRKMLYSASISTLGEH